MFLIPSESYEAVIDTGETGLVATLGTVLIDNEGATTQAFSSAGVIEYPAGTGVYQATRVAPGTVGQYTLVWREGAAGEVLGVEDIVVTGDPVESSSVPPSGDDWQHGPCSNWIDGDDVADCCDADAGSDSSVLDDVAQMGSYLLFILSGRKFNGVCQRTVRPCRSGCSCWNLMDYAAGTLSCDVAPRCGCNTESYVRLAGYPIREIVEVKIDGDVVDPGEYRLEDHRRLLRLADVGPPIAARVWPACQNIALADDQEGTFSITYTYGTEPPMLGRRAAAQLACELWKACPDNAGECALPNKVTRIVRQGITIEKIVPLAELMQAGATGLPIVDAFLAAVGSGRRRRAAVWSPDVPAYGPRTD